MRYIINGREKGGFSSFFLREKLRLQLYLVLSILLHALILLRLNPPQELARQGAAPSVLTVTLMRPISRTSLKVNSVVKNGAVISSHHQAKSLQNYAIKPLPVNLERNGVASAVLPEIMGGKVVDRGSGKLKVLLVIDSSGRVGHIHWNQLPAMTKEELNNLEQKLRQKIYLSNGMEYTVIEEVE